MNTSPLVSVIVPCYNQAKYLSEALDSVISQTYTNWECIIVNDGSTDNTETIVLDYCAKETRFKYFKTENRGLSSTRNTGLKLAKGTWIQFLDSDDYIVPDKLLLSINETIKHPLNSLIVSNFKLFVDNKLNTTLPYTALKQDYLTFENLLLGWDAEFIIPIHSGLFKAELFKEHLFNEALKANEDWIMWLNIFSKEIKAVYLPDTFAYYRINPTSITKDPIFVHDCLINAYKYIIGFLPDKFVQQFSITIINRLNTIIKHRENEINVLRTSIPNKIIWKLKRFFKGRSN